MSLMLLGALSMANLVTSMFFLRYWKTTRDRFFLFFSISFCIDAFERVLDALHPEGDEDPMLYGLRLVAFLIIILAILDKNSFNKGKNQRL